MPLLSKETIKVEYLLYLLTSVERQIAGPRPYVTQVENIKESSNDYATRTRLTRAGLMRIGKRIH